MFTVLVTGGKGYIGRHLVTLLKDRGFNVISIDCEYFNENNSNHDLHESNVIYQNSDIRIKEDLTKSVKKADVVIHLAGIVGEPACSYDSELAYQVNVIGTKNLLDLSIEHNVKKFIFASSCSVYGFGNEIFDENSQLNPIGYYAKQKIESEKLIKNNANNIDFSILRFSTLFGYSERMRFDLALNVMTANGLIENVVNVFGGKQERPFIHCYDVAKAIIKILESNKSNDVINVGDNRLNCNFLELGKLIAKKTDAELNINTVKEDDRSYFVSFDKIKNEYGFEASKSLEDGIDEIMNFINFNKVDINNTKFNNLLTIKELMEERV